MGNVALSIVGGNNISITERSAVKALCDEAFEMDFSLFLASFPDSVHVLAWEDGCLVSHALWLQVDDGPLLRTAYVEAVATAIDARRRGLAAKVLRALVDAAADYDIAALAPSEDAYYARLGWERWQGPLFMRTDHGLVATPDEEAMIHRLPRTPDLDAHQPLSIEWRELEVW